jgi:hypothetical protein
MESLRQCTFAFSFSKFLNLVPTERRKGDAKQNAKPPSNIMRTLLFCVQVQHSRLQLLPHLVLAYPKKIFDIARKNLGGCAAELFVTECFKMTVQAHRNLY